MMDRMKMNSLAQNTHIGKEPDFDSHFHFLDGEYKYVYNYIPMKAYGAASPSFLRMYAIKLKSNTYVITGGGIKLGKSIQDSPGLKEHVLRNIELVRNWLISNGIMDSKDLDSTN